jgi:uncharacterized FAD-dependent dehydrogenase
VTYDAKPHVGTDVLAQVVTRLRERVIALGGEVRFSTRLTGLRCADGRLCGAEFETTEGRGVLPCADLILAPGHAARDTFSMLLDSGISMARKPFSMGCASSTPGASTAAVRPPPPEEMKLGGGLQAERDAPDGVRV